MNIEESVNEVSRKVEAMSELLGVETKMLDYEREKLRRMLSSGCAGEIKFSRATCNFDVSFRKGAVQSVWIFTPCGHLNS